MTSPYVVQTWTDGAGGGTPVNAARLGHIEAGLSGHETRIAAIETDSGWVDVTVNSGFAVISAGEKPQVRLRRGIVFVRGGWSNTGVTASSPGLIVGNIPSGYRPPQSTIVACGTSAAAAVGVFVINTSGDVTLRTSATVGSYYKLNGYSWLLD